MEGLRDSSVFRCQHRSMGITHDVEDIALAKNDDLLFFCQLEGSLLLEQCDRDITLQRGDLALIDPMLPYRGGFPDYSKLLVLTIPRREADARLGSLRDWV